jgi:Plant mobile domain
LQVTGRWPPCGRAACSGPPRDLPRKLRAQRQRFHIDQSLLSALVDRWRPETHTFHLPCGEVAPTLQDVAFLLGLPLAGAAVGPEPVDGLWMEELEARFAGFQRRPDADPVEPHPERLAGPSRSWLLQFQVRDTCIFRCDCYT